MILLDTHVLLWCSLQHGRLGSRACDQIRRAWHREALAVSAVSFWEVARLRQQGRVLLSRSTEAWRCDWLQQGLREIPLDGALAAAAAALGDQPELDQNQLGRNQLDRGQFNRNQFNRNQLDRGQLDLTHRCIVATALAADATLITADPAVLAWPGALNRLHAQM